MQAATSGRDESQKGVARYALGDLVYERGRLRVGEVAEVHDPAPVLYALRLPDGKFGYAYDEDLSRATGQQATRYHDDCRRMAAIHASHRR